MTAILQILTQYCDVYVDDVRLKELAESNPALYARRMWQYFKPAVSKVTLPTEMPMYLIGSAESPKMIEPKYDSTVYEVEEDAVGELTLVLGEEYAGYELCVCRVRNELSNGNIQYTDVNFEYDSTNGDIVIEASEEAPILADTVFEIDFYTDGYFVNALSEEVKNILAIAFELVWQTRFKNDWLSDVDKIEDKSFYQQNRANKMRANDERVKNTQRKLDGAMRRLEQNLYYKQQPNISKLKID